MVPPKMTLEPSAEALAFVDAMGRGKRAKAKCLDAFAQRARDRALEEAAQEATRHRSSSFVPFAGKVTITDHSIITNAIVAAIRALKSKEPT